MGGDSTAVRSTADFGRSKHDEDPDRLMISRKIYTKLWDSFEYWHTSRKTTKQTTQGELLKVRAEEKVRDSGIIELRPRTFILIPH